MKSPARSRSIARCLRARPLRAGEALRPFALIALGALLFLAGCGGSQGPHKSSSALVVGRRAAPIPSAQLAPAASLARRFAAAYAAAAYLRHPPRLAAATAQVDREIAVAAKRVPANRRGLRAHVAELGLQLRGAAEIAASAEITDGRSVPFSIGFTVAQTPRGWRVVSISTPE